MLGGVARNDVSQMTASGVPPHVSLLSTVEQLRGEVTEMRASLPKDVAREVLADCEVTGAVGVTQSNLLEMEARLARRIDANNVQAQRARDETTRNNEERVRVFNWGEHMHLVPEGFQYPKCTVKGLWDAWFDGYPAYRLNNGEQVRIAAARKWQSHSFSRSDNAVKSKATKVMERIIALSNHTAQHISTMPIIERDALFQNVYIELLTSIGSMAEGQEASMRLELSFLTLYDRLNKRRREN